MELVVAALALLTAASWGASSPLSKAGMERGGTPMQVSITVVSVSVVVYWLAILVQGEQVLEHAAWVIGLFIVTGVFATAIARLLSYIGVQRVGASVNSAAINTRPVWAMMLAVATLGEAVTVQTGIGVIFVVTGLIAIAFSEGGDLSGWHVRDLAFPLAAALTFAAGNVARRFAFTASDMTSLEAVAINETAGLAGLLVYVGLYQRQNLREFFDAPRRAYGYFIGCGLLSSLALFTLFEAFSRGRVVIVDPLSSPTSLFAILFTALFLGDVEKVTWRLIVGAASVVAGVVLITGPQLI